MKNIFMLSDASYDSQTKQAGLGVYDYAIQNEYKKTLSSVKSSTEAEYEALKFSIEIALQNRYQNVVFIYDNKEMKLEKLHHMLKDKIRHYQFLWLSREFLKDADKLANKARLLHQNTPLKEMPKTVITDDNIVMIFKKYSQTRIIQAFMHIANENERKILQTYLNAKEFYPPVLVEEQSLNFFSYIYNLLGNKKSRDKFFKYINKHYPHTIDLVEFKKQRPNAELRVIIKKIIDELQNKANKQKKYTSSNARQYVMKLSA